MFAVVTTVELPEGGTIEQGRQQLQSEVVPRLKGSPGFVSAIFLSPRSGREGLSVVVYDSEANANAAMERMEPPAPVKLISTEVREVALSA